MTSSKLTNSAETEYKRNVLKTCDGFEIVQMDWFKSSHNEFHSHGWSQCLVLIEDGTFENELNTGLTIETRILKVGDVLQIPMGAQHKMSCQSATGKTLHVYLPKISDSPLEARFHVKSIAELKTHLHLNEPTQFELVKKLLDSIQESSISTNSPFFMNQLFAGVTPQMLAASEAIARSRTTLATVEASPALSAIEGLVVEALGAQLGWAKGERDGVTVPGGSASNFMALHCARQKLFTSAKTEGAPNSRLRVIVSAEAHYSFKKACAVLGLGTHAVKHVAVGADGRMRIDDLKRQIEICKSAGEIPLLVCATAGTTVLGAFDPIDELADVCKQNKIWLHVDGAWGGPAIFSKNHRALMKGVEQADSITFDAHKLFGAELTCSFFLTKHSGILLEANDVSGGDYLFHPTDEELDRGKLSWQCGRGAEALSFWTIWKSVGTDGLGHFVDRLATIRDQTVDWISTQPRLQLVALPSYLNICVRVLPPDGSENQNWSTHVREQLKNHNLAMVNYSANSEGSFLRLILAHPFLSRETVQEILERALKIGH